LPVRAAYRAPRRQRRNQGCATPGSFANSA
jgi:hypothetical protein